MDNPPPSSEPAEANRFLAIAAVLVSITLWVLAVPSPVWETRSGDGQWSVIPGVLPALIGWLGILVFCPARFANLLLIPSFVTLFKGRRFGFWLSIAAFAIAATACMMPAIYGDNDAAVIMARRFGYYLWLSSFGVIALTSTLQAHRADPSLSRLRWAVLALVVLGALGFHLGVHIGVSPLETALKDPGSSAALAAALAKNPSQADKDSALYWAIQQYLSGPDQLHRPPDLAAIQLLIAAGANVNLPDPCGDTPLIHAAYAREGQALVTLLVRAGANVNARDSGGRSVLDRAQLNGSPESRQILLNAGARAASNTTQGVR